MGNCLNVRKLRQMKKDAFLKYCKNKIFRKRLEIVKTIHHFLFI